MQLAPYLVVQCLSALADLASFLFLIKGTSLDPKVSNVLTKILGAAIAFTGLRYWVFRTDHQLGFFNHLIKYSASLPLNIMISTGLLATLLWINIQAPIAKVLTDGMTFFLFFLLNKYVVFR